MCQHCGADYEVERSQENRTKFCSDACFRAHRNTRVNYTCDYCGLEFLVPKSKVEKVLSGKSKHLCCSTECAKNIQKPDWSDIANLFESYDYDLVSTEYISAKVKLDYICRKHSEMGIQHVLYNNLRSGFGCKYCGMERTANARRLSIEEVRHIFDRHDMILVDGQEYHNTSEKMSYICKHHPEQGIQYMTTSNAYKNHCPYCSIYKGEARILDYFIKNNIEYETQKRFPNLVGVGNRGLSYDFYLPKHNLLIEYQGQYHDGTANNQTDEGYKRQIEHDRRKKQFAEDSGIDILEIWYHDYNKINSILDSSLSKAS